MTTTNYTIDVASGGDHYRRTISAAWYEIHDTNTTHVISFYEKAHERKVVAIFYVSKQHSFSVWED